MKSVRKFLSWLPPSGEQQDPESLLRNAVRKELENFKKLRVALARAMNYEKALASEAASKRKTIAAKERQAREFAAQRLREAAIQVFQEIHEARADLQEVEARLGEVRRELKRLEKALQKQERRYKDILREQAALLAEYERWKALRAAEESRSHIYLERARRAIKQAALEARTIGKPGAGTSKRRLLFINGVIIFLIVNSLLDIAIGKQHWPFSNYPMFARAEAGTLNDYTFSQLKLYGVTQGVRPREIPLRGRYIQPFDEGRLRAAFDRMNSKTDPEERQRLLNGALRDFLRRYERLRQAGRLDGPPLQGIRLYELHWRLDPRAANRERPDYRELVAEVEQSRGNP